MLTAISAAILALAVLAVAKKEIRRWKHRRRVARIARLEVALGLRRDRWTEATVEASRKYLDGIAGLRAENAARKREDVQAASGMGA